jgi:hypothetical protein
MASRKLDATTASRTEEVNLAARMGALYVEPAVKGPEG